MVDHSPAALGVVPVPAHLSTASLAAATRCPPQWLALREPADHAARDIGLAERLATLLAAHHDGPRAVVIRDLGCGAGSMGRWLAPRLVGVGDQHWVLHDRDAELVSRAVAAMPTQARGHRVDAEAAAGDLAALEPTALLGTDAVVASALLDLLTASEVEHLAGICADARAPALVSLSVTGEVTLDPADELDPAVAEAFDAHQRRGGLLGPDAPRVVEEAFVAHGFAVVRAATPWSLGPDDGALLREWLRGRLEAACAQVPALRADAPAYLARRFDALAAGELFVEVGHVDLLAVPADQFADRFAHTAGTGR